MKGRKHQRKPKPIKLTTGQLNWVKAFLRKRQGIDNIPYTRDFDLGHASFCAVFGVALTPNEFWRVIITQRKKGL